MVKRVSCRSRAEGMSPEPSKGNSGQFARNVARRSHRPNADAAAGPVLPAFDCSGQGEKEGDGALRRGRADPSRLESCESFVSGLSWSPLTGVTHE